MKINSKKDYKVYRHQLFETQERLTLIKTCEDKANADLAKGRMTWPIRWMVVHLALYTGLRVSEIAALRIKRVFLDARPPYIYVHQGKRGKSRDVYIDRELVRHLQQFLRQKQTWGQSIDERSPLFAGRGGQCFTTTALYLSFREALKESGLLRDGLSIHSARHSYATLLYHKTKDLRDVQAQLGHSNIAMTTLYTTIMPEERGRIANMILDDEPNTNQP